jgi:REP element-mobilizing transposase RayT
MVKYDPSKHHRRSIRLKGYDYHNAGAYFVTICTKNRVCILEDPIVSSIIQDVWLALPSWFPTIELDAFVVMPNHVHFVVWIVGGPLLGVHNAYIADGNESRPYVIPKPNKTNMTPTLGDIVGAFKSLVFTVYLDWINQNDPSRRAKFWQQNYYEHIVRNDRELNAIRQYIIDNPLHWKMDRDNIGNLRNLPPPEKVEDYLKDIQELINPLDPQE